MLMYLQANLHPDRLNLATGSSAAATLPAALIQSHQIRAADGPDGRISLAWRFQPATGDYWHKGGTGGYSSSAFFNPKGDFAVIVLSNTAPTRTFSSFADRLGQHIRQRLAGDRAISLAN